MIPVAPIPQIKGTTSASRPHHKKKHRRPTEPAGGDGPAAVAGRHHDHPGAYTGAGGDHDRHAQSEPVAESVTHGIGRARIPRTRESALNGTHDTPYTPADGHHARRSSPGSAR